MYKITIEKDGNIIDTTECQSFFLGTAGEKYEYTTTMDFKDSLYTREHLTNIISKYMTIIDSESKTEVFKGGK